MEVFWWRIYFVDSSSPYIEYGIILDWCIWILEIYNEKKDANRILVCKVCD